MVLTTAERELPTRAGPSLHESAAPPVPNAVGSMLPTPYLLLLAGLAAAAAGQGGFYRDAALVSGALIAAALVASVGRRGHRLVLRPEPVTVALGAMALWAAAAGLLAGHLARAVPTVGLLAVVGATATVVRRATETERGQLVAGLIVLGAAVAVSGWIGVVWRVSPWAHPDGGLWRAATSITYANAAAAFLAAAALLALARLATQPRDAARRSIGGPLGAFSLLVGLGATWSRAGIAACLAGYCVLVFLLGPRRVVARTGRALLGAAIALAGLLPSLSVGSPPRPAWAVVGLVLGLTVSIVAVRARPARTPRPVTTAAVIGTALLLALGLGVARPGLVSFRADRLSLASPDRAGETQAALALVRSHLVTGVGPGGAAFVWASPDRNLVADRYAHDEYLQLAAEQGVVGVGLLAALGAAVMAAARRRPGWDDPAARTMWAGAAAGLIAVAGHSAFDFLWHVPAVALVAAVLIGLTSRTPAVPESSPRQMLHEEAI